MAVWPRIICENFILEVKQYVKQEWRSEIRKKRQPIKALLSRQLLPCFFLKLNLAKKLWKMAPWAYPTRRVREPGYWHTAIMPAGSLSGVDFQRCGLLVWELSSLAKLQRKAQAKRCRHWQLEVSQQIFKWSYPVNMAQHMNQFFPS